MLNSLLSDFASLALDVESLTLALVFLTAILGVMGIAALFGRDEVGDRMKRLRYAYDSDDRVSLREQRADFRYRRLFDRLQRTFEPRKEKERSTLRRMLVRAGYMRRSAIVHYYLWRLAMALALPIVSLIAITLLTRNTAPATLLVVAIFACAAGYFLPYIFLRNAVTERQRKAREGFPDALDMLLVCVEAGLGLTAGIERVSREIGRSHPVLAEQFSLIGLEMRAGTSRSDALKNFSDRIGVEEINAFVTLLNQSEQLGTSIADSLRVYAHEMRTMRILRAEEMANKLPVKITIPLGLGILPCLIIVIMTPVGIRVVRAIFPALGG
jgi:tight adherence protein C